MIPSLQPIVDFLRPAFTLPSFTTAWQLLLAWVMCLGQHTLRRVSDSADPRTLPDHSQRHDLDSYYHFFERSAWPPRALAYRRSVLIFTTLQLGGVITLLVDDTLAHKRGKSVWDLGWFREAVASTRNRVATASGHNWVVVAVAVCVPFTHVPILALPLVARLHRSAKQHPSCVALAKELRAEVLAWYPQRRFMLVGDGAYAAKDLLAELNERVTFVGRLRGDAVVDDPRVPTVPKGKRGPKPTKGPRLPSPKEAGAKADRKRTTTGAWVWQAVTVTIYGATRELWACAYTVVWPRVLGLRPLQIVVVRDPAGRLDDIYLFTTDLQAELGWVITQLARRWSIEVLFRASKQVMDLEAPQHRSQASVEKVAPWVWSLQRVIMVWYISTGYASVEAAELRTLLGEWDSEWSLRHMLQVLRQTIVNTTINPNSADDSELREMIQPLKTWAFLAA